MAHISIENEVALDSPTLVEGLPGLGLVGKIAADHLVETYDMTYYGAVRCDGLPRVTTYRGNSSDLLPPVRLYADGDRDLLVLQSDVPVSTSNAEEFAACITGWLADNDVTPLYVSGLPTDDAADVPEIYGVATGDADGLLDDAGIVPPADPGLISGPTGALLAEAADRGLGAVGLIAEATPQFPDPAAARVVLKHGVTPATGVEVDTDELVEHAEEIQQAREQLAQRMQQAEPEESSQAQTLRGFQ